jgi:putative flippase GtrA
MLKREIIIFLIVGTLTVLVDFSVYRGLLATGLTGYAFAKATGFITGTVFAYFANRFWTFGHKNPRAGSAVRFILLYTATLAVNVGANALVLETYGISVLSVNAAFLIATSLSATLNFIGMKGFVFKSAFSSDRP